MQSLKRVWTPVCWGVLLLLALIGCARSQVTTDMALDGTWHRLDIVDPLPASGWVRGQGAVVHIYIEGDGVAYVTPTTPSVDPTPLMPMALLLARRDNALSVAYVGRPCQYVSSSACTSPCWTTGRFSPAVLQSMTGLVDAAKAAARAERIILIGFSGGGAVAALLAEQRTDVVGLVTVCGNLDHAVWTAMHNITPLYNSLNPADQAARLSSLPQVHFVGKADRNVTRAVTDAFVSRLGPGAPVTIQVLPGLAHGGEAWVKAWPALLAGIPWDL